jgi:excinuclease ABC subunit C
MRETIRLGEQLAAVPKHTGVYILKGAGEKVLYVGKAKNLRARLGSYFQKAADLDRRKASMVKLVRDFSYIVTQSELEALALEANLIKQYKPRFNVILRDDKNYPYIKVTLNEEWPRLDVVRRIRKDGSAYFGPYVPARGMKEVLRFINRNFGLRPCRSKLDKPMRPCVQYDMGRCPAPCAPGMVDRDTYREAVREAVLFLKGKQNDLLEKLEKRMQGFSDELRFEEAADIRDRIRLLRRAWEHQKVVSPELGDLDVLGVYREGKDAALQAFFVRSGMMIGVRGFSLKGAGGMAQADILHDFILGFYSREVIPPPAVAVAEQPADSRNMAEWLTKRREGRVRIVVPKRGKREELLAMAEENARVFHAGRKAGTQRIALEELRERLAMKKLPRTVGAFDISTLSGNESVGAFVCWHDGEFDTDRYRHLRIRGTAGVDDYAMMRETVRRVLADVEAPDLVVIDGGRAHLEAAMSAARTVTVPPPMIAVAKKPDRAFIPSAADPLNLEDAGPSSLLLKRIRDEVHRFAITYHKKLRHRRLLESPLETVHGIGKKRRLALLKHFGSLDAIRKADMDELAAVPGMNRKVAEALRQTFEESGGGNPPRRH